jgi:hypothetical protein
VKPGGMKKKDMAETREIREPAGRLGVLIPGMGAVATTLVAGVELIKKGYAAPVGSLTQLVRSALASVPRTGSRR